jgi:F-type H+-transporting ATPase subunit epsilon
MAIDSKLNFSLVSPEQLLFSSKVWMVTVPGEEGDMGVLFGHAPVLSTLRSGLISIFVEEDGSYKTENRYFVEKGFVRIDSSSCTVLAEEVIHVSELDAVKLEKDINDLSEKISFLETEIDKVLLQSRLDSCHKKLEFLKTLTK